MGIRCCYRPFIKFVYLKNGTHLLKEEIFRVHLLEDPSIKLLYQRRLEQNLMYSPCSHNINVEWQTLNNTLQQAVNEALGKKKMRRHKRHLIL